MQGHLFFLHVHGDSLCFVRAFFGAHTATFTEIKIDLVVLVRQLADTSFRADQLACSAFGTLFLVQSLLLDPP